MIHAPAAEAQEKTDEHYAATVTAVGGVAAGGTASIDIYIDKYTTDDETIALATLLAEKGKDALRREMEKKDVGRISISSQAGIPIAVARSLKNGKGRIIRIFIARNVGFLERSNMTRSQDYPFSIIQLQVDEKGQGDGIAIAAAKMVFDAKAKQFVVESLGQGTSNLKLVNVRRF